jgi:hypothetical protein
MKTTKKKQVWFNVKVCEKDYKKVRKFAEVREMSIAQIISLLINK